MRSRRRVSLAGLVALLVLAACSSDEPSQPDEAGEAAAEASPSPQPEAKCPLTGEDPPGKVDVTRPAVAVKIENSPQARPQSGLESADVVFEEIVEGGITRFMAIYHCGSSKQAGPVRSARFDDPKIVTPFTRVLAYSGANAIVERELKARRLVFLDEDNTTDELFRVPEGVLELHNLFADSEALRKLAVKRKVGPPLENIFAFGELPAKAKKARSVSVNFTGSNTIEYRWEGGSWKRYEAGSPFLTATGEQIAVPNVLIQEVDISHSEKIVDVAGNPSPDISLVGKGRLFLFRDGKVIKGTWLNPDDGGVPAFQTRQGETMTFAPGPIWVELVPSAKGTVKGSFSFSK